MIQPTPSDPFGEISIKPECPVLPGRPVQAKGRPPRLSRQGVPPHRGLSSRLRRGLLLLGGLLGVYLLCGYFLVPYLMRDVFAPALGRAMDRPLVIGQVAFDPLTLRLSLTNGIVGPRLSDPSDRIDPLISFARLTVDLELGSLARGAVVCRELTVDQPFVHLVRHEDGKFNLAGLGQKGGQGGVLGSVLPRLAALAMRRYACADVSMSKGELLFDDLSAAKVYRLHGLALSLPMLANIPGQAGRLRPAVAVEVNGRPVVMRGETVVEGGAEETRLAMKVGELDLAALMPYLSERLGVHALAGQADVDVELRYAPGGQEALRLAGAVVLRGVTLAAPEGELRLDSALVKGWALPLTGQFHVRDLMLHHPVWQWSPGRALPLAALTALVRLEREGGCLGDIDRLQISKGTVRGLPSTTGQGDEWQSIDVSIHSTALDSGERGPRQVFFSVDGHDLAGSSLSLQGDASTRPLAAKGLLVLNKIDIVALGELWSGGGPGLPLRAGAIDQVRANFELGFAGDGQPIFSLGPLAIQARDLRLEQDGQVIDMPVWQSEQGSFSLAEQVLRLGKVRLQQARITCRRQSATGGWQTALAPTVGPFPRLEISALELSNATLFLDNQGPPDIHLQLERLDVQVEAMDSQQPAPFTLAAMLDDRHPLQASGTVSLSPFAASVRLQASDLPLASFAPVLEQYFLPPLAGLLSVEGTLQLPDLAYQGQWSIADFTAPPLRCRLLRGEGMNLVLRPLSLSLDRLEVEGPALRLGANLNGMPQFPTLLRPGWSPAESPQEARVRLKHIEVSDGRLEYDFPGPPALLLGVEALTASVEDCLVDVGQELPFALSGEMAQGARLEAKGRMTPFANPPGLTMAVRLAGLPLSSLAPVLEPSLGHALLGGSLDFVNELVLTEGAVRDSIRLSLGDLRLGRPFFPPPDEVKGMAPAWRSLPLAQALLQNEAGRIEMSLPIDGRLERGFRYQDGLRGYLQQLLLKAAVSPAVLLGGAEDGGLEEVAFGPGSAQLAEKAGQGLGRLAGLLRQRPLLAVRLLGSAEPGEGASADLARRRGQAVYEFLRGQGVEQAQLVLDESQVAGADRGGEAGRWVRIGLRRAQR